MNIQTLIQILALCTALSSTGSNGQSPDNVLGAQVLGTWQGTFEWQDQSHPESWIRAQSTDLYRPEGLLTGTVDYQYPDRTDRVDYEARWEIQEGFLKVEILRSSGGFLKPGAKTRDKIVSLSETEMVLRAEDGRRLVLRRSD